MLFESLVALSVEGGSVHSQTRDQDQIRISQQHSEHFRTDKKDLTRRFITIDEA